MTTTTLEPSFEKKESSPIGKDTHKLYIELDDSLLATNTFLESLLLLLKKNPFSIFQILIWTFRGFRHVHQEIAKKVHLDASNLPFRQNVIGYLREEATQGRDLVLITGWNLDIAHAVSTHLKLFSQVVLRSDLQYLSHRRHQQTTETRFDPNGLEHITPGQSERQNFEAAQTVTLVQSHDQLLHTTPKYGSIKVFYQGKTPTFSLILKALRVHQWVKNILLFFPVATAHHLFHFEQLFQASLAFVAFSFCASGLYIFNDLLDLPADRRHPKKQSRPFASGALSIKMGLWLQPVLLCFAFSISLLALPPLFSLLLGGYAITTVIYSTYLKKIAILDVLTLAGFYTVRIIAGGAAVSVPISAWLLAFSIFFFLSLAFGKRYAEIRLRKVENFQGIERRAYVGADKEILATMGTISGYMSVLVLALYINSPEVSTIYANPNFLWFICPLLLYWVSRTWLLAHRGSLDDDPLMIALKDPSSYAVGAGAVILAVLAI
ncbi:UbiA family prenyltransferase [Candidatus Nitronereus thalassa]|uniref:UbiA family prenyltransferase n=1 Tax=Candidatus Nitronereus thalassa TaxID=3020898 RepID=A0ABU3K3N8_9BACT|nr:UbiA family prenyltransferase [Candidatus Nitronereus thalassa]MDT7040991.1 UbiA family prenyltransferase [Candidatus Nitronereus thalassa]